MKIESYFNFWKNVEDIMDLCGTNLKQLSSFLNFPYTTLYYQYKNKAKPDIYFVSKLASNYGLSVEQLLVGTVVDNSLGEKRFIKAEFRTENESTSYDKESGILTIPFIGQKISAGYGEDELPPECLERKEIDILAPLAKGHEPSKLVAAEVKGDSMIEANIFPGDIVIFHRGLIEGAGIYVLSMVDEVLVKRLEFNPFARELRIISENAKYEPLTVSIDMEGLRIIGKVVSWIHYEY